MIEVDNISIKLGGRAKALDDNPDLYNDYLTKKG